MATDVEKLLARIAAVRLVRVEVKRKAVKASQVSPGTEVKPNLWPKITLECEGKTRTIAMTQGIGKPLEDTYPYLTGCQVSREIIKLAAGRSIPLVNHRMWTVLHETSAPIRASIVKRMRSTASKKTVVEKVKKEARAHERAALIKELSETLKKVHGVLSKRDVIRAWESVHKDRAVSSVMEA
jgi:hypothetical protein